MGRPAHIDMSRDWQTLLTQTIPLAQAMQVAVRILPDGIVQLDVPLAPNVNDKGTGFGGSVAALATLAGWVETQRQLDLAGVTAAVEIVVQRGETRYLQPIHDQFTARAELAATSDLHRFLHIFERKGLARLAISVGLYVGEQAVAQFSGDYVARRAA